MVNNTFITLKARKNPVFSKYFKKIIIVILY